MNLSKREENVHALHLIARSSYVDGSREIAVVVKGKEHKDVMTQKDFDKDTRCIAVLGCDHCSPGKYEFKECKIRHESNEPREVSISQKFDDFKRPSIENHEVGSFLTTCIHNHDNDTFFTLADVQILLKNPEVKELFLDAGDVLCLQKKGDFKWINDNCEDAVKSLNEIWQKLSEWQIGKLDEFVSIYEKYKENNENFELLSKASEGLSKTLITALDEFSKKVSENQNTKLWFEIYKFKKLCTRKCETSCDDSAEKREGDHNDKIKN